MKIQSAHNSPCGCPCGCSKGPRGALRVFEQLVASLLARLTYLLSMTAAMLSLCSLMIAGSTFIFNKYLAALKEDNRTAIIKLLSPLTTIFSFGSPYLLLCDEES